MQIMESELSINVYKRGMSTIVATIALIMITIAAAAFLAGFVVPFVKDNLNEGTECIGYEEYFSFYEEFDYNCYLNEDGSYIYAFSVEADTVADEKVESVKGFRLGFQGENGDIGVEVANNGEVNGEIRMLDSSLERLAIPEGGEVKTYVYSSDMKFDSLEIYPTLKNGRMCSMSDKINLNTLCVNGL